MYGEPKIGYMPDFKPVQHEETPQCTRACLHPMCCNLSCEGNYSPAVAAILSTYHCEGCEE
jgi:hypothetical protein